MLNIRIRVRVGINIVVLRGDIVACIVSRHGCIGLSDRRKDGVILIVDGDGRLAEMRSTSFRSRGAGVRGRSSVFDNGSAAGDQEQRGVGVQNRT
jgi:hypothetical protein